MQEQTKSLPKKAPLPPQIVKCFPNSSRPLFVELQSGLEATDEDRAGWEDHNLALKARRGISALIFPTPLAHVQYMKTAKSPENPPTILFPDGSVGIIFNSPDWKPRDFRVKDGPFKGSTIVNVGHIMLPPSDVGSVAAEYTTPPVDGFVTLPVIPVHPHLLEHVRPLNKPWRYGHDIIPIKGYLAFSFPQSQPFMEGGVLDTKSKNVLAGKPKIGKSRLALYWAFCLALKMPFLGIKVERTARVLYIQFEVSEERFQERVNSLAGEHFKLDANTNIPLFIKNIPQIALDSDRGVQLVREYINECRPQIVFLDPLYKIHGREENSNSEMQAELYNRIDELIDETGMTVIITHHVNKGEGEGWARIRGASQLAGWVDSIFTLDEDDSGLIDFNALLRNGPSFEKSLRFNEYHAAELADKEANWGLVVAELLLHLPGLSRKELAQELSQKHGITLKKANSTLRTLASEGHVIPD